MNANTYTENWRAQNRNTYVQLLNTSISRIATAGCLVLEICYRVTANVYLQLTKLSIYVSMSTKVQNICFAVDRIASFAAILLTSAAIKTHFSSYR